MSAESDAAMIAFDALGVGVAIKVEPAEFADAVRECIPRGAAEREVRPEDAVFGVDLREADPDAAIPAVGQYVLQHLAQHAPDHVIVHAEVLAIGGRAVVLLGAPEPRPSAIAAALVGAGCAVFADSYVTITSEGMVQPYLTGSPRPEPAGDQAPPEQSYVAVIAAIGVGDGADPAFREAPRNRGAELLFENTLAVEAKADVARKAAKAAIKRALVLEGEHRSADAAAAVVLARLAGGAQSAEPEPPPAIRFVTLVFDLETQLVELAKAFEEAGIDATLLNGAELLPAFSAGFADSTPAVVVVPHAQVPRALGVMQSNGWRQTPGERDSRFHRSGVVVRIRSRPSRPLLARARGLAPGPVAKGKLGFPEPTERPAAADVPHARKAEPLDPGGPLRTGAIGAVTQAVSEALTVLDTVRSRTREREFSGLAIQYGPGVFGFEKLTEPHLQAILSRLPGDGSGTRFVEVGTATGAVALAVAHERPRAEVLATDVSLRALGWARRNRRRLGLSRVKLAQGSLLAPVPPDWRGTVTVVAANPPLAPPARGVELSGTSGWPAGTATGPGADGLGLVRAVARDAQAVLAPGGYLQLQVQGPQGPFIAPYLEELGYEVELPSKPTASGTIEVAGRKPPAST